MTIFMITMFIIIIAIPLSVSILMSVHIIKDRKKKARQVTLDDALSIKMESYKTTRAKVIDIRNPKWNYTTPDRNKQIVADVFYVTDFGIELAETVRVIMIDMTKTQHTEPYVKRVELSDEDMLTYNKDKRAQNITLYLTEGYINKLIDKIK